MSKVIPTPYMWTPNPRTGFAADASQDYSTKMHWLSAGPHMIGQVNDIRDTRNGILMRQAAITETPRILANPPIWSADAIYQPPSTVIEARLPRNPYMETFASNNGMQIAGGSTNLCACDFPATYAIRSDGLFQVAGGGDVPYPAPYHSLMLTSGNSTVPRYGGIGLQQFTREFQPTVYINPYSGPPSHYPHQFISNYDVEADNVDGYI